MSLGRASMGSRAYAIGGFSGWPGVVRACARGLANGELFPASRRLLAGIRLRREPARTQRGYSCRHGKSTQILPIDQWQPRHLPRLRTMGLRTSTVPRVDGHQLRWPPDIPAMPCQWIERDDETFRGATRLRDVPVIRAERGRRRFPFGARRPPADPPQRAAAWEALSDDTSLDSGGEQGGWRPERSRRRGAGGPRLLGGAGPLCQGPRACSRRTGAH